MDFRDAELARMGDSSKEAIAARLRAVRETLGITQREMAARLGIEGKVYEHREMARSTLTIGEAWEIYTRLGIDPRFTLYGDPIAAGPSWTAIREKLLARQQR